VDFRDLNKACPKDDFPLPVTEIIIDHTSSYEVFSFMDGYTGYNQIKMAPEDEKHTAFRTPIDIYCYKVMPFGLKNAGATYQRAMTKIFDDLIHKIVECYVDDLVIKAMSYEEDLQYLEVVFKRLREHALKLNPLKCAFMVSSGKFLGFVIRHRGIEIDPDKIKAITELSPPKNLKQLRSLQGQLAYIRRFIANLSGKIQPFTRLTKKDIAFKCDGECQQAFEEIKAYLLNPPVLAAPIPGKELILYTTALDGSLGALLAQENQDGNKNALYYLSRMMVGAEHGYSPIGKHCLALIFAVKKLRHYMLAHKIILISKVDPLKYLMTRPMLTGRLAKWAIILTEFDITYTPQKAIKGQVLADFLAAHPIQDDSPLKCDFPDEETLHIEEGNPIWELYFDGASSIRPIAGPGVPTVRAGVGLVFVTAE
jgi:RNase H-like domain found in reverse transcriptase/Reverse transcriptase (RNA-dependent DNA polymerase)